MRYGFFTYLIPPRAMSAIAERAQKVNERDSIPDKANIYTCLDCPLPDCRQGTCSRLRKRAKNAD